MQVSPAVLNQLNRVRRLGPGRREPRRPAGITDSAALRRAPRITSGPGYPVQVKQRYGHSHPKVSRSNAVTGSGFNCVIADEPLTQAHFHRGLALHFPQLFHPGTAQLRGPTHFHLQNYKSTTHTLKELAWQCFDLNTVGPSIN